MRLKTVFVMIVAVAAATGCARGLLAPQWGVQDGRLASCEGLRGCVSSQAESPEQLVAPLVYVSGRLEARSDLIAVVQSFRGAQVVSSHPVYLRVEFTSRDVPGAEHTFDIAEFYFPQDERIIHVRSTPRRNMPDSGENRNRMEQIRLRFISLQEQR